MIYETHHRFNAALHAGSLASIAAAAYALTQAIDDCRTAGKSPDRDPAVLLIAQAIGSLAGQADIAPEALRTRCVLDRRDAIDNPPLTAIAGQRIAEDARAKRAFHADAARALMTATLVIAIGTQFSVITAEDHDDNVTVVAEFDPFA